MKNWYMYGVTIASVLIIGYIKLLINQYFQIQSPILLFFVAITISAWVGGFFHGMLATISSAAFIGYYLVPEALYSQIWYFRSLLYFFDGFVISLICSQLRSSRNKLDRAYRALKRVEKSLRQRESQIGRIFESNMLGIVFTNLDGTIIDTNDYFLNLLKLDKEKLKRGELNWQKLTPPDQLSKGEKIISELLKSEKNAIEPFEKEYLTTEGRRVNALVGVTKADQETLVAFVLDITRQKEAEKTLAQAKQRLEEGVSLRTRQLTSAIQELSDSQSFLQSVIENIPNMIFVKDAKDLKFVRFNKAGAELLGIPAEELIGKSDYDFFPKEQAEFFIQKDREVLSRNEVLDIPEEPLQTSSGIRYLHTVKIPILNKHGEPQYLLGISQDITEQKNNEAQRLALIKEQVARVEAEKIASRYAFLSTATAKLNASLNANIILSEFAKDLVENMSSWCIIDFFNESKNDYERFISGLQKNGEVISWAVKNKINSFERRMLDYIDKEGCIYHQIDDEFMSKLNLDRQAAKFVKASGGDSAMVVPLTSQKKNIGTIVLISRPDQEAYVDLDLTVVKDLAKRASLAMDNANFYFKANEANRAKSSFLANMSHEIRTPLGAMLGFAEIILDDKSLQKETASYVSTILKNGHQLLSLVDEVLDIAKIESEKIQIENVRFSPQKHIEDILDLLKVKASEKGLELNCEKINELPKMIKTDPLRLRQILLNVVGNAIKFTEQGHVDVNAKFIPLSDSTKGKLEFVVRDTGIGVSENNIQHLFAPFSQGDSSMTRKFGGTGLGLYLSRKLARLLGGDLILNTKSDAVGCEFVITIEVECLNSEEKSSESDLTSTAADYQNRRVLVVDDSFENRIIVRSFLEKMNLSIDEAANGEEGIRLAKKNDYDVTIMDIQMPVMDGFKAVEKLRRDGYQKPVIALTAHAMKGDREKCLEHGFDDYLCKPLSKKALYSCVEKFIVNVSEEPKAASL